MKTKKIAARIISYFLIMRIFQQIGAAPLSLTLDVIRAKARSFKLFTRMKCAATGRTATVSMVQR